MSKLQKPGEKPDRSGEYIERGPRGGEVSKPRQVQLNLEMINFRLQLKKTESGRGLVPRRNKH